MTNDEFLEYVLDKNKTNDKSLEISNEILPILKKWKNDYQKSIEPSGSYAKGTAVKGSSDIDLFITLKNELPDTLENMFINLFIHLYSNKLNPKIQNVSMNVIYKGVSIDIVPGRLLPNNPFRCSLWQNKIKAKLETNVHEQKLYIDKYNRKKEIKLVKILRNIKKKSISSYFIELLVIEALKGCGNNLEVNLIKTFNFIKDNVLSITIDDPANSNNHISNNIDSFEKNDLKNISEFALSAKSWQEIYT